MPIIRIQEIPYAQVSTEMLRDKRLSWKSRGIMAYILSCRDGWDFSLSGLAAFSDDDGIFTVRSAVKELRDLGYIVIKPLRGDDGKMDGQEWYIYNTPQTQTVANESRPSIKSSHGELDTNNIIGDNKLEKDNNPSSPTASDLDKDFSNWWQNYPKKVAKGSAIRSYKRARKTTQPEILLAAARKWDRRVMAGSLERKFVPNPATWLNDQRWLDEDTNKQSNNESVGVY